jgi:hypothetical protein
MSILAAASPSVLAAAVKRVGACAGSTLDLSSGEP